MPAGVAGPVTALEAELSRVRADLAQLKGGVNPDAPCGPSVKRPCRAGQVRGAIPAMPTLVPAELNLWLEERHADLHEALLKGDSNRALELTAKWSDGVGVGGDVRRDAPMSAEAKQCRRLMAKYGFRGQRIGEASNPGPSRRRSQFETQLDSDSDAPLITAG